MLDSLRRVQALGAVFMIRATTEGTGVSLTPITLHRFHENYTRYSSFRLIIMHFHTFDNGVKKAAAGSLRWTPCPGGVLYRVAVGVTGGRLSPSAVVGDGVEEGGEVVRHRVGQATPLQTALLDVSVAPEATDLA